MGPLISAGHRDSVASFLDGADIAFRGSAPDGGGFWFAPAVVLADPRRPLAQQEVFGPVVAVMPFEDEADAIRLANDTPPTGSPAPCGPRAWGAVCAWHGVCAAGVLS